jgi:hypothetical protein
MPAGVHFADDVLVDAGHDAQHGGFAGAVEAEQADLGAGEEGQRDVLDDLALGRDDLAHAEHGHDVLGHDVLDFVCLEMRLIVEVDGGQHQDCEADQVRDRRLHEAGFRIMRFWNNQVLQETDAVVEAIWMALQHESGDAASLLTPSPPQPSP